MIDKKKETKFIGRYIVTDPNICHGKPTFRGTRIGQKIGIATAPIRSFQ
jgi:hypothetical protein